MKHFETFLREVQAVYGSGEGAPETSYYAALSNLLDGVGATLKPRVKCIINPKNRGAGTPDGGFYTRDQFQRSGAELPIGTTPSRGALEVKGVRADAKATARGEQVQRYLDRYRQVLVTNLREWILVGHAADGRPAILETFTIAPDERAFRQCTLVAHKTAEEHGERFEDFLRRVLLHTAPLASPEDLAWFLASYARDARLRIADTHLDALDALRSALEEALGMEFTDARGEHFFRSTLVQTLFYGVFSAWVLWCKDRRPTAKDLFNWRETPWYLHVPMIRSLFEQVASPAKLKPLNLEEVLDWATAALNRVDRGTFFNKFQEEHAVQYFYEPFLKAFDPELRKQLGVWYTPPEVVQYMVSRVDTVLREELGITDGLADERVVVLDPCTGTGSYLVDVLRHVAVGLGKRYGADLAAEYVKQAALKRVFGFEILPAPFVVAHLQLGLLLQSIGVPLKEGERIGVYLTNALTGWDDAEAQHRLSIPEMEEERDAAEHVKREEKIIVILGNPPYNGFAGAAVKEERSLTESYRKAKRTRQPQGQGLNDLYVRFFRMAERRIVERTGMGIVCFISNYSWLDGLSFTAMRERFLDAFDNVWIDNLHGDRIISEYAPDGRTSETIFATGGSAPGIKVGTTVSLLCASRGGEAASSIRYRDFHDARASDRRAAMLDSTSEAVSGYAVLEPSRDLGFPFKPAVYASDYLSWPSLPELFPVSFPGVKTSRDDFLVDIDRDRLAERMERYFDTEVSNAEMRRDYPGVMTDTGRFKAEEVRRHLQRRGFLRENIVPYAYRPFDVRWLYWEPETKLLDEKRPDYFPHVFPGNVWIEARQKQPMEQFDRGLVTTLLADNLGNGLSNYFPLYLRQPVQQQSLFANRGDEHRPNVSDGARRYFSSLDVTDTGLLNHVAAILRAPLYDAENRQALRQDWPRVPLPTERTTFERSASLGARVAKLLDPTGSPLGGIAPPVAVL